MKPGREVAGSITTAQLRKIAETKMKDLNANSVEAAMQTILGFGAVLRHRSEGLIIMAKIAKRFAQGRTKPSLAKR